MDLDANNMTKFVIEKFSKLEEGEKVIESFACALQLKILLQGRVYITNKRVCFHSYFNNKTIFGKETRVQIHISNIQKVEKKTNAMVFDNSVGITTKEGKEFFLTSFVFRDIAYELILKQIEF